MVAVDPEVCEEVQNYGAISQSAPRQQGRRLRNIGAVVAGLAMGALLLVASVQHSITTNQMLFGNEVSKMENVKMDPRSFVTKVSDGLSARAFMEKVSANFHSELRKSSMLSVTKHLSKAGSRLAALSSLANETDAQLDKTADKLLKAQLDRSAGVKKPKSSMKATPQKAVKTTAKASKSKLAASHRASAQVEPTTPVTKGGLAAAKKTSTLVHSISGKSDSELDREAEKMMKKLMGKNVHDKVHKPAATPANAKKS